jgi:hypothetical protein
MRSELHAAVLRETAAVSSPGATATATPALDAKDRIMHTWAQRVAELEHVTLPLTRRVNALYIALNCVAANSRSGSQRKKRGF